MIEFVKQYTKVCTKGIAANAISCGIFTMMQENNDAMHSDIHTSAELLKKHFMENLKVPYADASPMDFAECFADIGSSIVFLRNYQNYFGQIE